MAASASKRKKASAKRSTQSPGGKHGLTAERIRDEALRLIDAEGLESFSTRRLGAALGCEAMAIYWYYPSKDALLDAVVEALIARLPLEPSSTGDWIDALRKLAHAYRRLAHQHPRAFPLLATRRFATEGTWLFLESLFELAHASGLDPQTSARFFRLVSSYCSGVALDELAGLRDAERGRSPSDLAAQHAADREKFPRLAEAATWLEPTHFDDVFSFGLELLLDALGRAPVVAPTKKRHPSRRE
ncbi:MAG: TetR/AcrR family transcriptional regulator C-terminal domain-containing protein [Labilithrix sp.]|nr:TetR/AcrR family transcriptional regulator C-terminal domain-containing protein [Labilithrix sp.]